MATEHAIILRAAKAKLNAGGHLGGLPTRAEFTAGLLDSSFGTMTGAEIDAAYTDASNLWAEIMALPGVQLSDHGCAYLEDAGHQHEQDTTADADAPMADFVPGTVEEFLAATQAKQAQPANQPAFMLTITGEECADKSDGHECGYTAAVISDQTIPAADAARILRKLADTLEETTGTNNGQ